MTDLPEIPEISVEFRIQSLKQMINTAPTEEIKQKLQEELDNLLKNNE